jgi:hypothetical protein
MPPDSAILTNATKGGTTMGKKIQGSGWKFITVATPTRRGRPASMLRFVTVHGRPMAGREKGAHDVAHGIERQGMGARFRRDGLAPA